MTNKFPDKINYTLNLRLSTDAHSTVNSTGFIVKNFTTKGYRIQRTIRYKDTFSTIREYMFAGLHGMLGYVFDSFGTDQQKQGELKNYFAICIETGNDTTHKVLSFDLYLIQSDDVDSLLKSDKFLSIPGIDEKDNGRQAIFNFGYQYTGDMESIGATTNVFHFNVFKEIKPFAKAITLPKEFDLDTVETKSMVSAVLADCDIMRYAIGISLSPKDN